MMRRVAALCALAFVLCFAQPVGQSQGLNVLPFSRGYTLTGNYVVGGVDLDEGLHPIVSGFSTATIPITGVPANADIVAAYLFWETITLTADESQAEGVKFRGFDVDINSALAVKKTSVPLAGSTASCWSSGSPVSIRMFRADVLRFLPMQVDVHDAPTGKRLVNDSDLVANGLTLNTVTLPARQGNQVPESAGASLVIIYNAPSEPLRRVVLYDGIHLQPSLNAAMAQTIQGFYKSSLARSAQITQIVGSGQPNKNDTVSFNGRKLDVNPFVGGSSSQRGWANPTYDVSSLMTRGTNSVVYGETVTTTIDHQPANGGNDCLSWGATVFSTSVADNDADGLPDGIEDATGAMKDPNGRVLPNLHAMGAGSDQRDLFVEVNAMWAEPFTSYGSATAPFSSTVTTKTDMLGHHHLPTPETLKLIGDTYALRGIRTHFDVGNVASYHSLGVIQHQDWVDDYTSTAADQYLVGNGTGANVPSLARGGELIKEIACDAEDESCHFPAYPGTVSWPLGMQFYRDASVGDNGEELGAEDIEAWLAGTTQRRRFDLSRRGLFRYLLYAHARGKPKSLPCLVNGVPALYDVDGTSCTTPNPDFVALEYHVPSSASGIADLPGSHVLVTTGLWDDFVGRPFARSGTTFHELGHTLGLWHGGLPAVPGNKVLGTANFVEPNCKPNYLSSMSYLFQVHGLFDDNDQIHLDYASTAYGSLTESVLVDGALAPPPPYQPVWFAPANSPLATTLGASPAKRFCGGKKFDPALPPAPMARVHAATSFSPFDWNGDTLQNGATLRDVNFDGTLTTAPPLSGFDDWAHLRLDQMGAVSMGVFSDSIGGIIIDEGGGIIIDEGGGIIIDEGGGIIADTGGGIIIDEGGGIIIDEGGGIIIDEGGGIIIDEGGGLEELSFNVAIELGKGRPYDLGVCVIGRDADCPSVQPFNPLYHRVQLSFTAPTAGGFSYEVQRKRATAADSTFSTVGMTATNSFVDTAELANGVDYAYRVRGVAADGNGEWSRQIVVTATNDAPTAVADGTFQVNRTTSSAETAMLTLAISSLLANDPDGDSPAAFVGRRFVLVTGPANGTLTFNAANGTVTYRPNGNFVGIDTFTYRTDDGLTSDNPQVPLSALSPTAATVTINVLKK